jgi:YHS domain-containing protein
MHKFSIVAMFVLCAGLFMTGIIADKAAAAEKKGKPQTICPIQGGEIDKSIYTDYKGYRIYFCCAGCPDEFKKDPEKYMKILRESGVVLEKTPKEGAEKGDSEKRKHQHSD